MNLDPDLTMGSKMTSRETMGTILAVSIGTRKGMPKSEVKKAYLRENHGVDGDCHAGPGNRQVSLLAWENALALHNKGIKAKPGDFTENIATKGLDFSNIEVGSRLRIGEALLEIAEIGKSEWKEGDYSFKGIALVAHSGLFARVITGGWIRADDGIVAVK